MFWRPRVYRYCLFVLTLGLVVASGGCGRKGALYHPKDDGKPPAEQTAPPSTK
jgi:predicted small lipoprotein YifL